MIPVMYADVNEIADIVRSVYKQEIEGIASPGGGGGGVNLAAMFMGGGGGGRSSRGGSGGGRAQKQIKLTLGIDSNTNQLIISSSDSLFREIDSLVYRLDEDARRANPTVTLVSLKSANARQVENALKSLMPGKINVTRSANTSSNSRSSSGGTSSQSGARSPEQVRQFMEMRQRMLQGGGGRGGQPTSTGRGGFDRGSSGRGGTTGRGGFGGRGGTGGRR
jgi:type II secretory pathway component GspD/PulD (secretin)